MSSRNRNRIPGVIKRSASIAFLLPASTTDSNDKKNLRNILELLKPPDKPFASKAVNFGVVNVRTKI